MPRTIFDTAEEICEWHKKSQTKDWGPDFRTWPAVQEAYRMLAVRFIKTLPASPPCMWSGDGIVILGGGRYWDSTYVTVRMIRHVGCRLPIQVWYMQGEITRSQEALLAPYGVEFVNADEIREVHPMRMWGGWQAKPFAVFHSRFARVLYLDADCYPVKDPTALFNDARVSQAGAVFYPDGTPQRLPHHTWSYFGMQPREEAAFESGQFWIDKNICHQELALTIHYNDNSDYYYKWDSHDDPQRIVYGDKDLFHMAWRAMGRDYVMFHDIPLVTEECYLHRDAANQVMFVHRCKNKFSRTQQNFPTAQVTTMRRDDLPLEDKAWEFFDDLKRGAKPSLQKSEVVVLPPKEVKIQKIVGHPISVGNCFNPGLLIRDDQRVLAYRQGHYNANVCMALLDKNWQPTRTWPLARWTDASIEDPRLFEFRNRVMLSYTHYDGHIASVGLATFGPDWSVEEAFLPQLDGRQHWEKNWVFFDWNNELFCVYSVHPHQILHVREGKAWKVWRSVPNQACSYGEARGGAPPVLHKGEYYHFFHSVACENGMRIYGIGVYTFEPHPPFQIRRFGVKPIMTADPAEVDGPLVPCAIFPGGALLHDGHWVLSCGYLDRECRLVHVPENLVEDILR